MRKRALVLIVVILVVLIGIVAVWNYIEGLKPKPDSTDDEALQVKRLAESFPAADEDYFADMDYGATKNPEAMRLALDPYMPGISADDAVKRVVRGRNNWIVWTAGNDRFWDELSRISVDTLDLLKTVSSHPKMRFGRKNRWAWLGLVNEPCFQAPTKGRADRYGLWLDERVSGPGCGPDPFENETKYPGVKIGARGKNIPAGSFYGYATGIVGLRLFPNPAFDEAAAKKWDAERYYTDPTYYEDAKLVKPYRVGMSCGFCHVGPNPSNPPTDPENPTWANLTSNPGAQYFWVDRIFVWNPQPRNFAALLFGTSRPGGLDTSFISSDQINNPRTMNGIYNLGARLAIARKWGHEGLTGAELNNKQFNDFVGNTAPLSTFYDPVNKIAHTPHVLKDGSDSVGALGALNRVYINIGLFSEEWLTHFIPLVGGPDITPMPIATMERRSSMWKATEAQTPDVALFFLATAKPDLLANAPGGAAHLSQDQAQLTRGKEVFAGYCARCHSSKLPQQAFANFFQPGCIGPNYMKCWDEYWKWTKTPQFRTEMTQIVMAPDFTKDNAMTTDLRVPVTLLETNACSPLATNGVKGNIWDNFSSSAYKSLPSVGTITVHHPYTGQPSQYVMPSGGVGFTRPPTLASIWSSAPFLLNNQLGHFEPSGSVEARLRSFDDGIRQLLWPQRRESDPYSKEHGLQFQTKSGKMLPGWIDRVTIEPAYLNVAPGFLPPALQRLSGPLDQFLPNIFNSGGVQVGPIPTGTPINLLSNIDLKKKGEVLDLALRIKHDLAELPSPYNEEQARKQFAPLVPRLLKVSKCSDFVINRGHYFGTEYLPASEGEPPLSDPDKEALIAFLKTF